MSKFIIIKEHEGFRLSVSKRPCLRPEGLYNIEFIQDTLTDGKVTDTSTYQFFMTEEELAKLANEIVK
jgi:hypothetical protein